MEFFNRDLSWLSFNERLLMEAARPTVPLMERIKFLSIYSSNLDEFYRVRMPALLALEKIKSASVADESYADASTVIKEQLDEYGNILNQHILPELKSKGVHFVYNDPIPDIISTTLTEHFFNAVAGFLQPILLQEKINFFPENNLVYLAVIVESGEEELLYLVNVPANEIGRFLKIDKAGMQYVVFLEDIIKIGLQYLFPGSKIMGSYNIKITRDAELNLQEEYGDDVAEKIEKQLSKRDFGFATRFLYEPGIPLRHLQTINQVFNLKNASVVEGGHYHNLKDLIAFPVSDKSLSYPSWPGLQVHRDSVSSTLFESIGERDIVIHPPYQLYDTVLRFFNEAAIDPTVEEIYTTLYRVANDSRIVHALISAAKNGKKVAVMVELKARFDEANNIKWAKRMKDAGVRIVYSSNAIKVHAKIALVKRQHKLLPYLGLLATGNLNESTARFYTDHILLTAFQPMLEDMQQLFTFLSKRKKPGIDDQLTFNHLLVAQFNLQQKFIELIDTEINNAKNNLPAEITIKLNNLEEEKLIKKLYDASAAGVRINLIVRSICRLVPGIVGQSENIIVKRIVDKYLEHGRVFIFSNNGQPKVFMGSADWMNRNIYRRIEVCFPVYDAAVSKQLQKIIALQWADTQQAVLIGRDLENLTIESTDHPERSQESIYRFLSVKN